MSFTQHPISLYTGELKIFENKFNDLKLLSQKQLSQANFMTNIIALTHRNNLETL